MARVIQFDTTMLKDGYSTAAAMIYGYLRWSSWETRLNTEITPSLGLMVKSLNIGRATVSRGIKELEKGGLIEVYRRYQKRNVYVICDYDKYPAITGYSFQRMVKRSTDKDKRPSPFWTRG